MALQALRSKAKLLFSEKYLLATNTGITIALSGAGDLMQQRYEILKSRQTKWDGIRTRNILLSSVAVCPAVHYWYLYLDRFLPGKSLRVIAKKVFADQMVMTPLCIVSFLGITGYLEGLTMKKIKDDINTKGLALFKAELVVWPTAQTIQFWLLPTRFRLLYDNLVCLGVDIYYYFVKYSHGWSGNHQKEEKEDSSLQTIASSEMQPQPDNQWIERDRRKMYKPLYITHAFFY